MEADFLNLTQGTKSVAEYEQQFTALSRFASKLVPDEDSRCRRFFEGLRPAIKSRLSVLKLTVYADMVDRAMIAERYLTESQNARDNRSKSQQGGGKSKQGT